MLSLIVNRSPLHNIIKLEFYSIVIKELHKTLKEIAHQR